MLWCLDTPMVMAALSSGSLRVLRGRILKSKLVPDKENLVFLVIKLQRYLLDPDFNAHTGLDAGNCSWDAYDVTLTDGEQQMKCVLNPSLNYLAQSNNLYAGCLVRFQPSHCHVHFNDLQLNTEQFVIINQLEVLDEYTDDIKDPELLSSCHSNSDIDRPLVTGRGTYLPLWNNEDFTGLLWKKTDISVDREKYKKPYISLDNLSITWKRPQLSQKQLIVRVINKARLRMYGKKEKCDKWPFQLNLVVADETGMCSVVIWGALCLDLLYRIHEGSVLVISSYRVKRRYQFMSVPTYCNDLRCYDIEVSLDKKNPPADVSIIPDHEVLSEWNLPPVQGRFFNRKQLSSLPNQFTCDIIGVVQHIGRYYRIRKENETHCWCYRWLHLMDSSSNKPIIVQLFSTSQPEVQKRIFPGTIIIITQMRVIHNVQNITNSRQQRLIYMTTNNESQVTIAEENTSHPWINDDAVKNVYQWSKTQTCEKLLAEKASFGGYEDYSGLPADVETYKQMQKDQTIELTAATVVPQKLSNMFYRELIRINIQGILFGVHYHPGIRKVKKYTPTDHSSTTHTLRSGRVVTFQPNAGSQKHSRDPFAISEMWTTLVSKAAVCGQETIHPSAIRRIFILKDGLDAYNQHLAMPGELHSGKQWSNSCLSDLPACSSEDYLTLMISDLNYEVAILAHFLLPESMAPDLTLTNLLSGQSQSTMSYSQPSPNKSQIRNVRSQSKAKRLEVIHHLISSCNDLLETRMLFVLDLYSHGSCEEIIVNRAYLINY